MRWVPSYAHTHTVTVYILEKKILHGFIRKEKTLLAESVLLFTEIYFPSLSMEILCLSVSFFTHYFL